MNTLKSYISESLLDIDNIDNIDALIKEFLEENYEIKGTYTIKNGVVDVKGNIIVINKKITRLTSGLFQFGKVNGNFSCGYCISLMSLMGAPVEVSGNFSCSDCKSLTSLEGAPKEVGLTFDCSFCKSLTSLEGAPKKVGNNFYCNYCESLKTLEGAPEIVERSFYCYDCGKQFTKEEVSNICKVKKDIYLYL